VTDRQQTDRNVVEYAVLALRHHAVKIGACCCVGFSLVIIAGLALLVGLLILAVGVICLKR